MFMSSRGRAMAVAVLVTSALLGTAGAVTAGECPADKIVADGQGAKPGPMTPKGVVDSVLGKIPLGDQIGLENRDLRLRRLVIQPGGVVPWHTHTDRPAIIHLLEGTVVEYRSTCAVPIVHEAGAVAIETKGLSHWWRNEGQKVAVLTSADIFHMAGEADAHSM